MVSITSKQVRDAWHEIHRQEEMQRSLLELEERRRQAQQVQKQANTGTADKKQASVAPAISNQQGINPDGTQKKQSGTKTPVRKKQQQSTPSSTPASPKNELASAPTSALSITPAPTILPAPDDDEPDQL